VFADGAALRTPVLLSIGRSGPGGGRTVYGTSGRPFSALPQQDSWRDLPAIIHALVRADTDGEAASDFNALTRIFADLWERSFPDATASDSIPNRGRRKLAVAVSPQTPEPLRRRFREIAGTAGGFDRTYLIDRSIAAALGWQQLWRDQPSVAPGTLVLVIDAEANDLSIAPLLATWDEALDAGHHGIFWSRDLRQQSFPVAPELTGAIWHARYLRLALEEVLPYGPLDPDCIAPIVDRLIAQGEAERMLERSAVLHVPLPDAATPTHVLRLRRNEALIARVCDEWCEVYENWLRRVARDLQEHLDAWAGESPPGQNGWRPQWHILYVGRPFHFPAIRRGARLGEIWSRAMPGTHLFQHFVLPEAHQLVARGCGAFLARHFQTPRLATWKDRLAALHLETETELGFRSQCILREQLVGPDDEVVVDSGENARLELPAGERRYLLPVAQTLIPLISDDRDLLSINQTAVLEPPGFPFPDNVEVDVWVEDYRYGSEDYRLRVKPVATEPAPAFAAMDAGWVNVVRVVPEFTADSTAAAIYGRLFTARRRLSEVIDADGPAAPASLLELQDSLNNAVVPEIWPTDPADDPSTAPLRTAASQWFGFLASLFPSSPGRVAEQERDRLRHRLGLALATAIEALRLPLPRDLTNALHAAFQQRPVRQNHAIRLIGQLVRDVPGGAATEGDDLLVRVVTIALRRLREVLAEETGPFDRLNPPLAALGLVLASAPDRLAILAAAAPPGWEGRNGAAALIELARGTLAGIREVLTLRQAAIAAEEDYLRTMFVAFRNCCELLLGLLRLRAPSFAPAFAELVEPGIPKMHAIARGIHEIAVRSASLEFERPRSRLVPGRGHDELQELAFLLYRLLAGHDPHRLIRLQVDASVD
jgi:hypothetical protein